MIRGSPGARNPHAGKCGASTPSATTGRRWLDLPSNLRLTHSLFVRNTAPVTRKQRMGTTGPAPVDTCLMTNARPIFTVLPCRRRPLEAARGGTEEDFWRDQFVLVFKRLSTGTGPVALSTYCKTLYDFRKQKVALST